MMNYFFYTDYENERLQFFDFIKELVYKSKSKKVRTKIYLKIQTFTKQFFDTELLSENMNERPDLRNLTKTL